MVTCFFHSGLTHLFHAGHRVGVSLHQLLECDGLHVSSIGDLKMKEKKTLKTSWTSHVSILFQ